MKITHNPHGSWERPSTVPDAAYEAEVQHSTRKAERLYRQAERRLAHAEQNLQQARAATHIRAKKSQIASLEALVEIRRAELEEYWRLMVAVPASAVHRGSRSFRPVPVQRNSGV